MRDPHTCAELQEELAYLAHLDAQYPDEGAHHLCVSVPGLRQIVEEHATLTRELALYKKIVEKAGITHFDQDGSPALTISKLREALQFYATEEHWDCDSYELGRFWQTGNTDDRLYVSAIDQDFGHVAREALGLPPSSWEKPRG